jgi:hypothetical protein
MDDNVNHPPHYNAHPSGIECVELSEVLSFNLGNALKYVWRAGKKGSEAEDLKKAEWYLCREIERLEKWPRQPIWWYIAIARESFLLSAARVRAEEARGSVLDGVLENLCAFVEVKGEKRLVALQGALDFVRSRLG